MNHYGKVSALLFSAEAIFAIYIREYFDHNHARMIEVLKSWNNAKLPTVGQILKWFELFEVNRKAIKLKYESLSFYE